MVVEQQTYVIIPLEKIVSKLPVRRLSPMGVKRLQESIQRSGFLDNFPLIVCPLGDGTYQLIEGNHRYEAAKEQDISAVPCIVKIDLSESERYKLALQSNSAAETVVPSTLVTYAEFVWARSEAGDTQEKIAEMLGWSREKVAQYAALKQIDSQAWQKIVTTFEQSGNNLEEGAVTSNVTTVTFTERLLRSILDLTPEQQFELVSSLAHPDKDKRITKERFTNIAKAYKARNEMYAYAKQKLGDLGEEYTSKLNENVYSGAYDSDWVDWSKDKWNIKPEHPKLDKLIVSLRDEWERKHSIHPIHGDFYTEVALLGSESIDLILTDPPYNVASKREFVMEGRSNISQDFGEWDKYDHQQFIDLFKTWGKEWMRILRSNGSGYVFTSDIYISHLREALEQSGFYVKSALVWHKTNPPTQFEKTTFRSTVEYILFFTKSKSEYTFNWLGDKEEMHNFISCGVCSGDERLNDAKGDTLHPTQKPQKVLKHLIEISSNRGDMIFDGFAGVGSTGKSAKALGRKFIGIEQDDTFFAAMQRWLADE